MKKVKERYEATLNNFVNKGCKILGSDAIFRQWLYTYNIILETTPIILIDTLDGLKRLEEELDRVDSKQRIEQKMS